MIDYKNFRQKYLVHLNMITIIFPLYKKNVKIMKNLNQNIKKQTYMGDKF